MNYHKVKTAGFYAQDQIDLGDVKGLVGLRWDHFEVDSRNQLQKLRSERSTTALSPRIGAVWEALPDHHVYASWSKNYAPVGGDVIGITPEQRAMSTTWGHSSAASWKPGSRATGSSAASVPPGLVRTGTLQPPRARSGAA
jgi:iron complex outermembrane receptor protein